MSNSLMCHVVAGYPDTGTCIELMRGMSDAGVSAIEVQIPFSDPIADGETIMRANDVALAGGMTTAASFELITKARNQGVNCAIYVMSYLQKVQHFRLEMFCHAAAECGAKGLIIPDMPYESPEYARLSELAAQHILELVPVISPGMPDERLKALLQTRPRSVYVTSQRGITGNAYSETTELKEFVGSVRSRSDCEIMVGFGISSRKDVENALRFSDMAVVGSAIIKSLQKSGLNKTLAYIASLTGSNQ